ncbi:hypothetical protein IAT38_007324 [Cryptococcus sp. DSM 104549]
MRFRTAISNVGLLYRITRSLGAIAKQCVIRLGPDKMSFIVPGNESSTGVQVWSTVAIDTLFTAYRIESNSNNEIWVEITVESLNKVLRSADQSVGSVNERRSGVLSDTEVILKLNKKGKQPIWSFEIRGYTAQGKQMCITHEVNVKILTTKRQEELQEPLCPQPEVHVVLPPLRDLQQMVSRLAPLADDIAVSANGEAKATMELAVKGPMVEMTSTWKNLPRPTPPDDTNPETDSQGVPLPKPDPSQMFSTTVTIKGFLNFLTSHHISGEAIMCICEGHCIIVYVYIGPLDDAQGVLTFYIPGKAVDDD